MSEASYASAFAYTLVNEGKSYTDNPIDHGGPTRYGITLGTLSSYLGRSATPDEVADLSVETASLIYRQLYWQPLRLEAADTAIATAVFDMAVLCGVGRSVKMAQRALGVPSDGHLGPVTTGALIKTTRQDFLLKFVPQLVQYFMHVVTYDPTQNPFLDGWVRRSLRLLSLLNTEPADAPTVAAL